MSRSSPGSCDAPVDSDWHFDVGTDGFVAGGSSAAVFRVEPAKVLAFAKNPHGQTTFRLARS